MERLRGTDVSAVVFEDQLEVPPGIRRLRDFRKWMLSESFPETGRIDFIGGRIEIEVSPEQFFSHGGPKEALARTLGPLNFQWKLGFLRIENTRVTSVAADLSAEPDLVFISKSRLETQEVKLSKAWTGDYLEVEGGPDLVVEVISPSSVGKDTIRLPAAYFAAGVLEYWLIDARKDDALRFQIYRRGKTAFRRVRADAEGFQKSTVFGRSFQLICERERLGYWEYELQFR